MKSIRIIASIVFASLALLPCAWGQTVPVSLTYRVDTTNADVRSIVALWSHVLNSRPDSVYNNPFWYSADRAKASDIDPLRPWVFQSEEMIANFRPTILAVEPENNRFVVRTMFASADPESRSVYPLAILRLYADTLSGEWKFSNALSVETQNWNSRTVGSITFRYPPEYRFNSRKAYTASRFLDSVRRVLGVEQKGEIEYVITRSRDELAKVLGFEYFVAPPYGISYPEQGILLTGLATEFHAHELVHMALPQAEHSHKFISEGVASFFGGSLLDSPEQLFVGIAGDLHIRKDLTFEKIFGDAVTESRNYYAAGALLCEWVLEQFGTEALHRILASGVKDEDLFSSIQKETGIERAGMDALVRRLATKKISSFPEK